MSILFNIGYFLLSALAAVGEYHSIKNGNPIATHIIWSLLILWGASMLIGFNRKLPIIKPTVKFISYFQLSIVVAIFIAYITGIESGMEYEGKNVTVICSVAIILWATIKIHVVNKYYANT